MRKKLFIGMFLAAVASMVAGEYLFNRSGAQDHAQKTEPKSDGNLFDVLKKDLEAKAAPPPLVLPPLPMQPTKDTPLPVQPDGSPSIPLPAVNAPNAPGLSLPPPVVVNAPNPPTVPTPQQTVPPPLEPMKPMTFPGFPTTVPPDPVKAPVVKPKTDEPTPPQQLVFPTTPKEKSEPKQAQTPVFPPMPAKDNYVKPDDTPFGKPKVAEPERLVTPPEEARYDSSSYPKQAFDKPFAPTVAQQVAKIKDCPWSLQVEMADGQTIVTATVNKRHEFKIVCKSLDLQTGKGILKATGKVTITGDTFNGTCEHLAIPLMEDRLVLEGGAAVTIQKNSTNVSASKPSAFELKGETLNLRISELHSGNTFLQTSWQGVSDSKLQQAAIPVPRDGKQAGAKWSTYGKLVGRESKNAPYWCLEGRDGNVIVYIEALRGGTLEQYVGQTISVYGGTRADNHAGRPVVSLTHIALP